MSILLVIVVVTFKSSCPYSFGPVVLCLVSLLIAFVTTTQVLRFVMLIGILALAYIRGMSLFTIEMKSEFSILTFVTSFFCNLR